MVVFANPNLEIGRASMGADLLNTSRSAGMRSFCWNLVGAGNILKQKQKLSPLLLAAWDYNRVQRNKKVEAETVSSNPAGGRHVTNPWPAFSLTAVKNGNECSWYC